MTYLVEPAESLPGVGAWFTTRSAGNLSHRRPHLPARLARDRAAVMAAMGLAGTHLHLMQQVHGAEVAEVTAETIVGAELRGVDALVTATPGRALAVQVADCVPLLLASSAGPVAAVHVGRRGLVAGVVAATLDALRRRSAPAGTLHAVLGPAIGGCCYEVPAALRDEVAADVPQVAATTTWGTPSLDLPAAVRAQLATAGAEVAAASPCTRCSGGDWFSHRRDGRAGRQLGIVVRWPALTGVG